MKIERRKYAPNTDYERMRQFLLRLNRPYGEGFSMGPTSWEYQQTHSYSPWAKLVRNGIWECYGEIVGAVFMEWQLGEAIFAVDPLYEQLKEEMLDYAEEHLSAPNADSEKQLTVIFVNQNDTVLRDLLKQRNYTLTQTDWTGYYDLRRSIPQTTLPEGFSLIDLTQENDLEKIKQVCWRGFNHVGEPPAGVEKEILGQSGPHYDPYLKIVIKAPSGEYAAYCGMWYEPEIRNAYLEPLCTHPGYRKMGLAKAALYEAMRRTQQLGAITCEAGGQVFYEKVGFVPHHNNETWEKVFR